MDKDSQRSIPVTIPTRTLAMAIHKESPPKAYVGTPYQLMPPIDCEGPAPRNINKNN